MEGFSATQRILVMLDLVECLKDLVPEAMELAECCLLPLGSHKCHEGIPSRHVALLNRRVDAIQVLVLPNLVAASIVQVRNLDFTSYRWQEGIRGSRDPSLGRSCLRLLERSWLKHSGSRYAISRGSGNDSIVLRGDTPRINWLAALPPVTGRCGPPKVP